MKWSDLLFGRWFPQSWWRRSFGGWLAPLRRNVTVEYGAEYCFKMISEAAFPIKNGTFKVSPEEEVQKWQEMLGSCNQYAESTNLRLSNAGSWNHIIFLSRIIWAVAGTSTTCQFWMHLCWLMSQRTSVGWSSHGFMWACASLPSAGTLRTIGATPSTICTGNPLALSRLTVTYFAWQIERVYLLFTYMAYEMGLFLLNFNSFRDKYNSCSEIICFFYSHFCFDLQGEPKDVVWRSWLRCLSSWRNVMKSLAPELFESQPDPAPPAGHHHEPKCASWSMEYQWVEIRTKQTTINNLRWESYLFMWCYHLNPFFL